MVLIVLDTGPFARPNHGGDTHGVRGKVSFPYFVVTALLFPYALSEVRLRAVMPADEAGLNLGVEGDIGLPSSCLYPLSWTEKNKRGLGTRRS